MGLGIESETSRSQVLTIRSLLSLNKVGKAKSTKFIYLGLIPLSKHLDLGPVNNYNVKGVLKMPRKIHIEH